MDSMLSRSSARGGASTPALRDAPVCGALRFAGFRLDLGARALSRQEQAVALPPKAMDMLLALVLHRERYLSKQELCAGLWGDVRVGPSSLAQTAKELRRALGDDGREPRIIRTLRGHGYQFVARIEQAEPRANSPLFALTPAQPDLLARYLQNGSPLRHGRGSVEALLRSDLPLLIEGETGTGKSTLALLLHQHAGCARSLRVIDCFGLSEERAAALFVGAATSPPLAIAETTTTVLDDVSNLPLLTQRLLSSWLDDELTRRAQGSRLIALSRIPVAQAVAQGLMRPELAARLCALQVPLRPLRERTDELPRLVQEFAAELRAARPLRLSDALLDMLANQPWPFNLRELRVVAHHLAHASANAARERVDVTDLPPSWPGAALRLSAP